jgi:hypothetical protein
MTDHISMFEAIDPTQLAGAAGGLFTGDGGCVRVPPPRFPIEPAGPFPFPQKVPVPPFDPTKIAQPSAA